MDRTNFWNNLRRGLDKLGRSIKKFWYKLRRTTRNFVRKCLKKFAKWIDPKLEPYRAKKPTNSAVKAHIPETLEEFVELVRSMPKTALSARERGVIATVMTFPERKVVDVMLPKEEITYVREDEVLGPLTLDRLYRSGFAHFPVINDHREIIGLLHTEALNSLEVREASRASEILDPRVCYLRDDYTLYQALAAFYRTNCYFFLVVDPFERIVGMLTYQMLADLLLGEAPKDDFDRDSDRTAVARRKM